MSPRFPQLQAVTEFYQAELSLQPQELPVFTHNVWPEFALALLTDLTLSPMPAPAQPTDWAYLGTVNMYRQWIASGVHPEKGGVAQRFASAALNSNVAYAARAAQNNDSDFAVKMCVSVAAPTASNEERKQTLRRQYQALSDLSRPLQVSVPVDL